MQREGERLGQLRILFACRGDFYLSDRIHYNSLASPIPSL